MTRRSERQFGNRTHFAVSGKSNCWFPCTPFLLMAQSTIGSSPFAYALWFFPSSSLRLCFCSLVPDSFQGGQLHLVYSRLKGNNFDYPVIFSRRQHVGNMAELLSHTLSTFLFSVMISTAFVKCSAAERKNGEFLLVCFTT